MILSRAQVSRCPIRGRSTTISPISRHCTGDLSLAESGLLFEADRHGEWRFSLEQIESLELLSETELELRTKMRGEGETFQFTFLKPPLEPARFHAYRSRVLARDEE